MSRDYVAEVIESCREGRPFEEVIDYLIDTCTPAEQVEILDRFGACDLREPLPDLNQGWERVRGQLAYNALAVAARREVFP